jgi:hypothetical protein
MDQNEHRDANGNNRKGLHVHYNGKVWDFLIGYPAIRPHNEAEVIASIKFFCLSTHTVFPSVVSLLCSANRTPSRFSWGIPATSRVISHLFPHCGRNMTTRLMFPAKQASVYSFATLSRPRMGN